MHKVQSSVKTRRVAVAAWAGPARKRPGSFRLPRKPPYCGFRSIAEPSMSKSADMRRLQAAWSTGQRWPKRLEWVEIDGVRGWTGQRIDFQFPIVALVGENGSGKSTVLQAAAAVYRSIPKDRYASDF